MKRILPLTKPDRTQDDPDVTQTFVTFHYKYAAKTRRMTVALVSVHRKIKININTANKATRSKGLPQPIIVQSLRFVA